MKGQKLFVREATPEDETAIAEFYRVESTEPPVDPASAGLVARLVGDLVAHVSWEVEGARGVITHVYVSRSLRHKRVGRSLMHDARHIARGKGLTTLAVSGTCSAREFFLRTGFAEQGDELVMEVD